MCVRANSQWKYQATPGQFSVAINSPSLGESVESYFARLVADNDVGCTPTRFAELAGLGSSGDPNMLMLAAVSKRNHPAKSAVLMISAHLP